MARKRKSANSSADINGIGTAVAEPDATPQRARVRKEWRYAIIGVPLVGEKPQVIAYAKGSRSARRKAAEVTELASAAYSDVYAAKMLRL